MMLKKVMQMLLLVTFFRTVGVSIVAFGCLFNLML